MKININKLDVFQMGKVYAVVIFAVLLLISLPFVFLFSTVFVGLGMASGMPSFFGTSSLAFVGAFFFILMFYTIISFIFGMLFAWVYNLTYKFHGGVSFETSNNNQIIEQ